MFQLQPFVERCQAEKWELPVGGKCMGYCSLQTTAGSQQCHQRNLNAWLVHGTNYWKELDCELRGKQAVWCTSAPDSLEAKNVVDDTVITSRTREQGFKALGAWIIFDGHFVKELAEREVDCMEVLLCDPKLLWTTEWRCDIDSASCHHVSHVIPVWVFWQLDSDTVTMHSPTSNPRQDVETNENVPGRTTETPEAHMVRWSKLLHGCRGTHKILHGDDMYFASYFSSCGHVARLTKVDPQRETSRIYIPNYMEWLRSLKKELGSQCHGRRFRVLRWEQAVAQCVGTDWTNVAQDRMEWRAKMDAMIKWRTQKNGGSKCQSHRMTIHQPHVLSNRSMMCVPPYELHGSCV